MEKSILFEVVGLADPRGFRPAPETQNLFDEVSTLVSEISEKRPFGRDLEARLASEFIPDRITATLNIEGISVSRRQTLLMMDARTITENSTKAEREILNALNADEFVYEAARSDSELTAGLIRQINGVLQEAVLETAGSFRSHDVEITGASFQPPSHLDVSEAIDHLIELFGSIQEKHPIFKAAWLHATFAHIHPFEDGNGRTSRLLQDWVLLSAGLFPTGIPSQLRDDYYDALQKADQGEWDDLCQMISDLQLRVLTRISSIIEERQSRKSLIQGIARSAADRKQGAQHKQYIVWRHRMEKFRAELIDACDELNAEDSFVKARCEPYEVIDFEKWRKISTEGRAQNTWVAKVDWQAEGQVFYRNVLFFSRHNFRPEDLFEQARLAGNVALYITGGIQI